MKNKNGKSKHHENKNHLNEQREKNEIVKEEKKIILPKENTLKQGMINPNTIKFYIDNISSKPIKAPDFIIKNGNYTNFGVKVL